MSAMSYSVPADDRAAIEDLLTEFYWRLDHTGTGTVADLFTESATLVTPRFSLNGREQIAKWFEGRTSGAPRTTRHSWSNLRLKLLGRDRLAAEAHVMTAASAPDQGAIELMIGDTTDLIVREASAGWRFAARRLAPALEGRLAAVQGHTP